MKTLGIAKSFKILVALAVGIEAILFSAANAVAEPRVDSSAVHHIDGKVVDTDGLGLEGAKVTATLSVSGEKNGLATNVDLGETLKKLVCETDQEGNYQIELPAEFVGYPELRIAVSVSLPGYLSRSAGIVPVSDFNMQEIDHDQMFWSHRQDARQVITKMLLRKGNPLAGRVLLPDGSVAVGANVRTSTKYQAYSWKFPDPNHYFSSDSAVTNAEGRFELITDNQATLTIYLPGQAPLIVDDLAKYVPTSATDPPNTYRLPRAIRPRGRVLTVEGKPIPGAIVSAGRDFKRNEHDMPVAFARSCSADEDGMYELPPLPAGTYRFRVPSRIINVAQSEQYNKIHQSATDPFIYNQPSIPTVPLGDIILDEIKVIADRDDSPIYEFQATKTVTVTVGFEFPDRKRPDDGRTVDLTVKGEMHGQPWWGNSAKADESGIARLIVPQGIDKLVIGTGLATHRRTAEEPVEIGEAIHLGTVTKDVSGLIVIRPQLAKLKVELELSGALSQQIGESKAFVGIHAYHKREGYLEHQPTKKLLPLSGARQIQGEKFQFFGTALPNEVIVLRVVKTVNKAESVLYEAILTLKPGEERLETIDLTDE